MAKAEGMRPDRTVWLGRVAIGLGMALIIANAADYLLGADAIPSAATAIGLVDVVVGALVVRRSPRS